MKWWDMTICLVTVYGLLLVETAGALTRVPDPTPTVRTAQVLLATIGVTLLVAVVQIMGARDRTSTPSKIGPES